MYLYHIHYFGITGNSIKKPVSDGSDTGFYVDEKSISFPVGNNDDFTDYNAFCNHRAIVRKFFARQKHSFKNRSKIK
ncbi:hypothetical protein BFP75_13190 [Maribacter sp. 4G9]|nr:hypothetical protein BFP75_13190 [Maribacter sp. 4G9]